MANSPVPSPTPSIQKENQRDSVSSARSDDESYYSDDYSDDYSDSYDSRSYSGSDYDSYSDDSYSDYSDDRSRSRSRSLSRPRSIDLPSHDENRSPSRDSRPRSLSVEKQAVAVIDRHISIPKATDVGLAFQELDSTLTTFSDFLQSSALDPVQLSDSQSMNSVQIHSMSESASDSETDILVVTSVATKTPIMLDDDSLSKPFSLEINPDSLEFNKKLAESLNRYRHISQESSNEPVSELVDDKIEPSSKPPNVDFSSDFDFQTSLNSFSLSRPTGAFDDQYDPLDFVGEFL
ncbi:hypothetical protein HK096_000311, partial [Nowakowskiella sp. JEL0078]